MVYSNTLRSICCKAKVICEAEVIGINVVERELGILATEKGYKCQKCKKEVTYDDVIII